MTISTTYLPDVYAGDGVTKAFSFSFSIQDEEQLKVSLFGTTTTVLVLNTDYTVSGVGNTTGNTDYTSGTVTLTTAPTSTEELVIGLNVEITQSTTYPRNGVFPSKSHEAALDKLTLISQELRQEVNNSLRVSDNVQNFSGVLPTPVGDYYIKFNETGTALEAFPLSGSGLGNVNEDLSPELGGNLDNKGFSITDSVGNITLDGDVDVSGALSVASTVTVDSLDVTTSATVSTLTADSLALATGATVTELSTDGTLTGNSDTALPTEKAVKTYVDTAVAGATQSFSGVRVTVGSDQTVTASVITKVQLDTEAWDTEGDFDSTTNYRHTPTTAGYYQVSGCVYGAGNTNTTQSQIFIYKNGSLYDRGSAEIRSSGAGAPFTSVISTVVYMNGSTDYIEMYGLTNGSGTPFVFQAGTYLNITYLGA